MKQNEKNSQKAQELTKEELEQVNGGGEFIIPTLRKGVN
jgi:bacteriocin-like protein